MFLKHPRSSNLTLLKLFLATTTVFSLTVSSNALSQTGQSPFPRQMAWTAYNLGSTGYNQAVAIGAMLREKFGVTLRVIPGQNDVSRLLPLKTGRVDFTVNGVSTYFAQEGMFQFANDQWGPQPVRLLMTSNGLSNQTVGVAADIGVEEIADLRGRRIPYVRGAPALNVSMEAYLACGNLTWDDVVRVDFPGYDAAWNGVINGDVDAGFGTTVSGPMYRVEASPRGIFWPPAPHDDQGCWDRMLAIGPYFTKHHATRGAGIDPNNPQEAGTYPYPMLTALSDQDENLVRALTQAIHENYDDFKDSDPGAIGWELDRQVFQWVVPYHDGAVQYWREIGIWTDELEQHNNSLVARQEVLAGAWSEFIQEEIDDQQEFVEAWERLRAQRLEEAGFNPVWR